MSELRIDADLVGTPVVNCARPQWGVGRVLRVQAARYEGRPAHRVSIQFACGHRVLLVPPARLAAPADEPERDAGWLDRLGGSTLDDRLRALPDDVLNVLGTPRDRLLAVVPLYATDPATEELLDWARSQTGVADPLTHWTRDELHVAFAAFAAERDAHLRAVAAVYRQREGAEALRELVGALPAGVRERVLEAFRRPI